MQVVDENWYKKDDSEGIKEVTKDAHVNKKRKVVKGADKDVDKVSDSDDNSDAPLCLPSASSKDNARSIICAVRKNNILCSAFHPELTDDDRWHRYFVEGVVLGQSGM